jgi:hypothetical protein
MLIFADAREAEGRLRGHSIVNLSSENNVLSKSESVGVGGMGTDLCGRAVAAGISP